MKSHAGKHRHRVNQGRVQGHVNNVFESDVGSPVAGMPLVRSVSAMSVYVTADSTSFWPPPQVGGSDGGHGGGETSRLPVIDPFLPLVNVPVALTGPPTVTLLASFGHRPPLFTQVQVALAVALAS